MGRDGVRDRYFSRRATFAELLCYSVVAVAVVAYSAIASEVGRSSRRLATSRHARSR